MASSHLLSNYARRVSANRFVCVLLALSSISIAAQSTVAQSRNATQQRPVARLVTAIGSTRPAAMPRTRSSAETVAALTSYNRTPRNAYAARSVAAPVAATSDEQRVFELINRARRANGLPSLALDGELCRLARAHSGDMASQRFFDHQNRQGLDAAGRARRAGVRGWSAFGENIALNQGYDDPAAFAVERWLKSAKHRANITHAGWTHTGLGVTRAADGTFYFTQVFMMR